MNRHLMMPIETCYCIRTTFNGAHGYFMSAIHWADNPKFATVFRSFEAAQSQLTDYRLGRAAMAGQTFDVVTMDGALTRPYA